MKVKIGDTIYSAEEEPILLILTEQDKQNIAQMNPKATKYCALPDGIDIDEEAVRAWMTAGDGKGEA